MNVSWSIRAIAGPSRLPSPSFLASPARPTFPSPSRVVPSTRPLSTTPTPLDKLKSHSGSKKRFFPTASGLWKRGQAGKQHLNTGFSAGRINRLAKTAYTTTTQSKMLRKLLPYA